MCAMNLYEALLDARDDPDLFQEIFELHLEEYLSTLPPDRRLKAEQLQWTIDGTLRKYKDPVARMNKMAELFWKGVGDLIDACDDPIKHINNKVDPKE